MKVEHAKGFEEQDHRSLALWAADCAEHVLAYFEENYTEDDRPRKAIEAGRAWARGEIACGKARAAAVAAHAAARAADEGAAPSRRPRRRSRRRHRPHGRSRPSCRRLRCQGRHRRRNGCCHGTGLAVPTASGAPSPSSVCPFEALVLHEDYVRRGRGA